MMTASGFTKVATNLKGAMPMKSTHPEAYRQWQADIMAVMQALRYDNPRLDTRMFLVACGVET